MINKDTHGSSPVLPSSNTHSSSFCLVPYNHLFETGISLPHILITGYLCTEKYSGKGLRVIVYLGEQKNLTEKEFPIPRITAMEATSPSLGFQKTISLDTS